MGSLEICSSPSKGVSSSRIKKIAPETDSAQTNQTAKTVALRGANRPKVAKMTVNQKTSTTRNGVANELPLLLGQQVRRGKFTRCKA